MTLTMTCTSVQSHLRVQTFILRPEQLLITCWPNVWVLASSIFLVCLYGGQKWTEKDRDARHKDMFSVIHISSDGLDSQDKGYICWVKALTYCVSFSSASVLSSHSRRMMHNVYWQANNPVIACCRISLQNLLSQVTPVRGATLANKVDQIADPCLQRSFIMQTDNEITKTNIVWLNNSSRRKGHLRMASLARHLHDFTCGFFCPRWL